MPFILLAFALSSFFRHLKTPSYFVLPPWYIRPVYTDGSRDGNSVACAIISMRMPDSASIFTAEIWVIINALEEIFKNLLHPNTLLIQTHFPVSKLYNL